MNGTWIAFSVNPDWSNVTKILNSTIHITIKWCIWANDTSDNWNNTGIQSFTTTGEIGPVDLTQSGSTTWDLFTRTTFNVIPPQSLTTSWNALTQWNAITSLTQATSSFWNTLTKWDAVIGLSQVVSTIWDILIQSTFNVVPTQAITTSWDVLLRSTFNVVTYLLNTFSWVVDVVLVSGALLHNSCR